MKKEEKVITFTKYSVTVLSYHLFYTFLWSYLTTLLLIYLHPKFHGKTSSFQGIIMTFILFENLVVLLFYHLACLYLKLYLLLKSSNKSRIQELNLGASFETILLFDFCTVSKILICFSLRKCFPSDYKRYSSHLQVSILHRVAPIKAFLL